MNGKNSPKIKQKKQEKLYILFVELKENMN